MLRQLQQYICRHHLLQKGDKVVVGISGGADSVALLDLLLRAGYTCYAVHCNFHLRGQESDRDEQFVRQLCTDLGVPLEVCDFSTSDYARQHHISIEMAAREQRYQAFEHIRQREGCSAIAVAHHADDQAETIILNLLRGTGIRGLRGMLPRNGLIIRPLLFTTHADILRYLTVRHLQHVEDSTNTDTDIPRNKVRFRLKGEFVGATASAPCGHPRLKGEKANLGTVELGNCETAHPSPITPNPSPLTPNPSLTEKLSQTACLMRGYECIVNDYMQNIRNTIVTRRPSSDGDDTILIDIPKLLATVAPETIIYELLRDYGFTNIADIASSLTKQSGKRFFSPTHTAIKDRKYLMVYRTNGSESACPQADIVIRSRNQHETYPDPTALHVIMDSSVTQKPITFRHYKAGDRFRPIGMRGTRKLQDFFTDLHLNLREKQEVWLMLSGDDIAWVVGYRISDKYKVTPQTAEVAEIMICNISE